MCKKRYQCKTTTCRQCWRPDYAPNDYEDDHSFLTQLTKLGTADKGLSKTSFPVSAEKLRAKSVWSEKLLRHPSLEIDVLWKLLQLYTNFFVLMILWDAIRSRISSQITNC